MNKIYILSFALAVIRLVFYFLKNNDNPNRKNTTIKEYKFSEESQKFEKVEMVSKSEREELKEFAKHHFQELKKINPLIKLEDDFPENIFPKALKKILLSDVNSDEDYIEAINSININFSIPSTVRNSLHDN